MKKLIFIVKTIFVKNSIKALFQKVFLSMFFVKKYFLVKNAFFILKKICLLEKSLFLKQKLFRVKKLLQDKFMLNLSYEKAVF